MPINAEDDAMLGVVDDEDHALLLPFVGGYVAERILSMSVLRMNLKSIR